ncbi:ABC transporter permease [Methanocaldococcus villosus KIN24-T80]|uniref:ABC transporter permease n=2 Tax=Methanocaldococcus villosus TaxID=667126 RepID=N6VT46_9EURY|nr:ABC transporter permease [Methanocaldococcus villosus KIN24-T80]
MRDDMKTLKLGLFIIGTVALLSLLAPYITENPYKTDMLNRLSPPSLEHPFGTDQLGRDLFAQVLYGARVSLFVAFAITLLSLAIGCLIGAISGYVGGVLDDIIGRIIDTFMSIPDIVLNIAMVGIFLVTLDITSSIWIVILAITITNWVSYARIARGLCLSLKEKEFVILSKACGASDVWILFKHIIPNMINPLIVLATLNIGNVILTISTLGFLGLGIQPPTPELGTILNSGKNYLTVAPWITGFSGLMIMIIVLGFNLIGEGLRDLLEPKSRYD